MEDYNNTKNKLFAQALEKRDNRPPLNINLDYNPETDFKKVGVDYAKGGFNVGGTYQPEYSTEQPGFMPGQIINVENPSQYNVRAGYKNKNFGFNVNVGAGGNYGGGMNFNRQF